MEAPLALDAIDLKSYWRILGRRRWVIYLAVVGLGLLALVGSFLTTPLYRATATLQIERQTPEVLNFRDVARTDYAWAAYADFYQTQYKILASRPVARRAAELLELTSHPSFAEADRIEPGWLDRLKAMVPRKRGKQVEPDPLDTAAGMVLAGLQIQPVRDSQLVQISWTGPDPEMAAELANAVAESFIYLNIQSRYSTTDQALEFLLTQIGTLKEEIEAIEERLQEYGQKKRIFSVDDSTNLTLQSLQNISRQRTTAQTLRAKAEAEYHSVLESEPEALIAVQNSTLISRLRAEYASYEADYSEKSKLFKDDWPELRTLVSRLEQARDRLDLETERIYDQVVANAESNYLQAGKEVKSLEVLLTRHEEAAQTLKKDAVKYTNLRSEVTKKRETLDVLLRRQNEMALSTRLRDADDRTSSNIRIMERAKPPTAASSPNTRLNVIMALALGLALGIAGTLVLEHLDNSISSPAELARILPLPVLAVIPRQLQRRNSPQTAERAGIDLVAEHDGRSAVAEAYRELRTSILLSNPGRPPQLILLTSALPEDGKTATALNLATVLAQLGRRVVVVDTDLRRPRLHRALKVENARGVSTYLSGLEEDPRTLLQPTTIENLDVMSSGPIPPNPSELLNSSVFARLGTGLLEQGYDHVLFDSPPVLSVSDPVIVASHVDTGILVVRAGRTPRQSVRLATARLGQIEGPAFGVVLNDYETEEASYRYRYYALPEPADKKAPARSSSTGS